jgi:2',3'-cyclic-nucleotide 2'-phosphodiesterase
MLKIIFFGDVTGEPGRKAVKKVLPNLIKKEEPDLVLANVENLAHGKGVTIKTIEQLLNIGVNGFTSGNHVYSKREFSEEVFAKYGDKIVRPDNIPDSFVGKSAALFETKKGQVLVGNFMGQVFMERQFPEEVSSPFEAVDKWLEENKTKDVRAVFLDLHAEATSEKVAFGYHVDGQVSAMVGTHTHIPTADAKILSGGTAYITDVGMCGAAGTVLGVKKELSLERFLTGKKVAFDIPDNPTQAEISYVIIDIDEISGKAMGIRPEHSIIEI